MSRKNILSELSPDSFLRLIGELADFDLGGRIRIYRLCTEYAKRMNQ